MDKPLEKRCSTFPEVKVLHQTVEDQVAISEIEAVFPTGVSVSAFYLKPNTDGRYPGILFSHWLEDAHDANKTQFLGDAKELARRGCVCLLIDTVFANWPKSRLNWTGTDSGFDREIIVQQIAELRYFLDFLRHQPEVDGNRLALVGHDFGAMFNSVLAGIVDDVKACVIMAAVPSFSQWFTLDTKKTETERRAYDNALADLAPIAYLASARRTAFFFQFGEDDLFFVPKEQAERLVEKTGGPKTVKWYESDHAIHHHSGATRDRIAWLLQQLTSTK